MPDGTNVTSYKDLYSQKIKQQETLSKELRERQKRIKEHHAPNAKQAPRLSPRLSTHRQATHARAHDYTHAHTLHDHAGPSLDALASAACPSHHQRHSCGRHPCVLLFPPVPRAPRHTLPTCHSTHQVAMFKDLHKLLRCKVETQQRARAEANDMMLENEQVRSNIGHMHASHMYSNRMGLHRTELGLTYTRVLHILGLTYTCILHYLLPTLLAFNICLYHVNPASYTPAEYLDHALLTADYLHACRTRTSSPCLRTTRRSGGRTTSKTAKASSCRERVRGWG